MKIPTAKAAVDKECEELEKIPAWNLTKVSSKKEVIDEARTKGAKVHLASLMDICHLMLQLPTIAASSDQASTVASTVDQLSLFGREVSPRMRVAIMNSKRFSTITWHSTNDLITTRSAPVSHEPPCVFTDCTDSWDASASASASAYPS